MACVESVAPSESVTVRLRGRERVSLDERRKTGSFLRARMSAFGARRLPERVVAWHQVGEREDRRVGGHLLFPQRTFDLLPQPGHHLVVVFALCDDKTRQYRSIYEAAV